MLKRELVQSLSLAVAASLVACYGARIEITDGSVVVDGLCAGPFVADTAEMLADVYLEGAETTLDPEDAPILLEMRVAELRDGRGDPLPEAWAN